MRAVFQRVKRAAVDILDEPRRRSGEIGAGAMILLAVENSDTAEDAEWLASKMAHLRVFEDAEGKMNLSLIDVGGRALVVSQFTLYGNLRKGTRRLSTGRPSRNIRTAVRKVHRMSRTRIGRKSRARRIRRNDGRFACQRRSGNDNCGFKKSGHLIRLCIRGLQKIGFIKVVG